MGVLNARVAGAWVPISASAPTAQDRWYSAWGIVASAVVTSSQAVAAGAWTELTGSRVTFAALDGRRYVVSMQASVQQTVAASGVWAQISDISAGNVELAVTKVNAFNGDFLELVLDCVQSPGATTKTYCIRLYTEAGTVATQAFGPGGSAGPALRVEDVGPITGIAVPTPTQDRWFNAWGVVASVSPNLVQFALTTTATTLTSLSVPTVVGRRYAVHAAVRTIEGTGGIPVVIFTCTGIPGDTVFNDHYVRSDTSANGYGGGATVSWRFTGDGTIPTLSLRAATYSGTASVHGQAGSATQFWVEDVGPVAGAVVVVPATQDSVWYTAWGIVGVGSAPFGDNTFLTPGGLVTDPLTVTTVANRRYRLAYVMRAFNNSANVSNAVSLKVDGVDTAERYAQVIGSNGFNQMAAEWLWTGAGGSHTFTVAWGGNANSYGYPSGGHFYIEDMGPITGTMIPPPQVTTTPWTAPTFQNGWADLGSGYRAAGYRKFGDMVQLRGLIKHAAALTPVVSSVAFTLPVGFRPLSTEILAANSSGPSNWGDGIVRVEVALDGTVVVVVAATAQVATGYTSLSGLQFSVID